MVAPGADLAVPLAVPRLLPGRVPGPAPAWPCPYLDLAPLALTAEQLGAFENAGATLLVMGGAWVAGGWGLGRAGCGAGRGAGGFVPGVACMLCFQAREPGDSSLCGWSVGPNVSCWPPAGCWCRRWRAAGRAWPCPYLLLFTYTQTTTHTPTHATALPADSSADADGRGGAVSRALYEGWRRRGQWARVCRLEEVLGAALPGSGTCVKQAMLLLLLMAFGMLTMPTALLLLLLLLLLMAMGVGLWHAGHACAAAASSAAAPTAAPRSPHGRMWWPAAC